MRYYDAAARLLGISRARVSQVMGLWDLPIATQEAILLGEGQLTERALRTRQ